MLISLFLFFLLPFLFIPRGRLSWLLSAFYCTLNTQYHIVQKYSPCHTASYCSPPLLLKIINKSEKKANKHFIPCHRFRSKNITNTNTSHCYVQWCGHLVKCKGNCHIPLGLQTRRCKPHFLDCHSPLSHHYSEF